MVKLSTSLLEIGMYVALLDRPWIGTPFLFQSFLIANEKQIQQLQQFCQIVEIDEDKSDHSLREIILSYKKDSKLPDDEFSGDIWQHVELSRDEYDEKQFQIDLGIAYQIYNGATSSLNKTLDALRFNKPIDSVELKACVHGVIDGIVYHPEAMALFSNLKSKQQDTVAHCLNVCILSLLFGRHLGLNDQQLSDLGHAALLHDIGEIKISQAILDKHNRGLTPDEKKEMEKHTIYGAEMLLTIPTIPETVIKIVRSHHERVNGKGYPDGLIGTEIDYFAKLVSIVDAYEIVTNHPDAKTYVSSLEGLKSIYMMRSSFFDQVLVEEFMKCLGTYPIGSVVQLNNGEIAIVICTKPGKHLSPTIIIIKNSDGILYQPKFINLENFKETVGLSKLYIVKVVDPSSVGIDFNDYMFKELSLAHD